MVSGIRIIAQGRWAKRWNVPCLFISSTPQLPCNCRCYRTEKKSPKLQFIDTGLINYFTGLQPQFFKHDDLLAIYKEIIGEHIVRQEIIAADATHNRVPPFWVRESRSSNAEVDMVLQHEGLAIPVKVKAGKTGSLRSLHQFMDKVEHPLAVRLYRGPLEITEAATIQGKKFKLLNLPYFLAGKIGDYISWFAENA